MKKFLFLAVLLLAAKSARAQQQTFTGISSATWSGIKLTTGTPVRIDNLNLGVVQLMPGRNKLVFTLPAASTPTYCIYGSNVSTDITKGNFSQIFQSLTTQPLSVTIDLPAIMSYFCQVVDAAGGFVINVIQQKPMKGPGE